MLVLDEEENSRRKKELFIKFCTFTFLKPLCFPWLKLTQQAKPSHNSGECSGKREWRLLLILNSARQLHREGFHNTAVSLWKKPFGFFSLVP